MLLDDIVLSVTYATCIDPTEMHKLLDDCRHDLRRPEHAPLLDQLQQLVNAMALIQHDAWDAAWMKAHLQLAGQWQNHLSQLRQALPSIIHHTSFIHMHCFCSVVETTRLPEMLDYLNTHASDVVDACLNVHRLPY
jgi:hypothetical protein